MSQRYKMKISTYNVNSVNARIDSLSDWLKAESPDIVLLQEIKCEFDAFPFFELQSLGYNARILGEKSYNGVAVLSRHKIEVTAEGLPGFPDEHARFLEARIKADETVWRVASIYMPNGNPPYNAPDDVSRFDYKIRWMQAFYQYAVRLRRSREPVILGGDFNVILTGRDVYDPEAFKNNALFRPEVRKLLKSVEYLGFYDTFRAQHPAETAYTYWDYAGGAFQNDQGLRIDYLLMSPSALDRLQSIKVDKNPRRAAKPSDHTVLTAELK